MTTEPRFTIAMRLASIDENMDPNITITGKELIECQCMAEGFIIAAQMSKRTPIITITNDPGLDPSSTF